MAWQIYLSHRLRQDESTTGWFAQWLARAECTAFLHPYPRPGDGCLLHFMSQEHHFVRKHPAYWPWKENVSFLQSEGFWKREGVMLVVFQFKLGIKSKLFIPHNSHTLLHETMKETTRPILAYFGVIQLLIILCEKWRTLNKCGSWQNAWTTGRNWDCPGQTTMWNVLVIDCSVSNYPKKQWPKTTLSLHLMILWVRNSDSIKLNNFPVSCVINWGHWMVFSW